MFFLVEEHAVLEGILPGGPRSPQSCTGAGLPLDGDGWTTFTLPSIDEQLTGLIRSQYCVWSRTLTLNFTFDSKWTGGIFFFLRRGCSERTKEKTQASKNSRKLCFEKWKKKKIFPSFIFFFFNNWVDDNRMMHWEDFQRLPKELVLLHGWKLKIRFGF